MIHDEPTKPHVQIAYPTLPDLIVQRRLAQIDLNQQLLYLTQIA